MSSETLIAPADSPKMVTAVGVAAERRDVVAYPLERGDLVEQADVARAGPTGVDLAQLEEAEGAQAVVHGDEHDAVLRERGPVVQRRRARAHLEAAAVDPDHDGQRLGGRRVGGPHVQVEAVLVPLLGVAAEEGLHQRGVLRGDGPERVRRTHAVPRCGRARAAGTGGRRPVAPRRGCRRSGRRPRARSLGRCRAWSTRRRWFQRLLPSQRCNHRSPRVPPPRL